MNTYALVKDNKVVNLIVIAPGDEYLVEALTTHEISVLPNINNAAVIDGTWNSEEQKFYPPKSYPSWVWDSGSNAWTAPVPRPTTVGMWVWNESMLDFIDATPVELITGPNIIED
jgi:hypothetical protein